MVTMTAAVQDAERSWRAGKPVEDPEKTKRWGFVTAKPSEYLVHMRRGEVLAKTSGQGASCFKWPWDSVAIIPTTLQRIDFQADQVTTEKVGVQVKGLSVYRVARPELAVRMLNFSFPERAQEKLAQTLRDMFVGAARRVVANLSVEECLTRRKEALAAFLMEEIAPVVSGAGRNGDTTDRGWGVVLDTIEIQDVRILSEKVFIDMQAPYRNQLMLKAREAELIRERELEQARARAAAQLRELKAQAETRAAQSESTEQLKRLEVQGLAEQAALEHERAKALARIAADLDVSRERAKAEREAAGAADALAEDRAERARVAARAEAASRGEVQRLEMELARLQGELEAALLARRQEIENSVSAQKIQSDFVNRALPEIAHIFEQQFGKVEIIAGGDQNPFGFLVHAFEGVMELARKGGFSPSAETPRPLPSQSPGGSNAS